MSSVTIRGSVAPSSFLARGETVTVARTAHIDRLIARGYVEVVGETTLPAPEIEGGEGVALSLVSEVDVSAPPARNASRDAWAAWLDDKGIAYPPVSGRDDLIAAWDDAVQLADEE